MSLLNPGYWNNTYWPDSYWNALYWQTNETALILSPPIKTFMFTDSGTPKSGLSPIIDVWAKASDGNSVASPPTIYPIADGLYRFEYGNITEKMVARVNSDDPLMSDADRYKAFELTPSDDADFTWMIKIIKNKKVLVKTGFVWQLVIYDDDDITPILSKDILDKSGNNITDLEAGVLAQEIRSII